LRKRGDDGRRCTSLGVDRGIQGADPKVVGGWYRGSVPDAVKIERSPEPGYWRSYRG